MADIRSFFGGAGGAAKRKAAPKAAPSSSDPIQPAVAGKSEGAVATTAIDTSSPPDSEKAQKTRRVVPDSDSEEEFDDSAEGKPKTPPSSSTTGESAPAQSTETKPVASSSSVTKMEDDDTEAGAAAASSSAEAEEKKKTNAPAAGGFFAPRPQKSDGGGGGGGGTLKTDSGSVLSGEGSKGGGASSASSLTPGKPVEYSLLTDAFSKIEDISSRLEITAILTTMFETVVTTNPADLEASLFLASNKVAPPHANMILGIGEALITKCIVQTFGRTTRAVKEAYDDVGDLGLVAEQSRASQKQLGFALAKPKPLGLSQVLTNLRAIAGMEGAKVGDRKIQAIQRMLRDSKGPEARFIIRALQGKLRIGLAETTVLVALAHACVRLPPPATAKGEGEGDNDDDDGLIRLNGEVPLLAETRLFEYFKLRQQQKAPKNPPPDVLEAAVVVVKQAFAECSDHGMLSKALLSAPLHRLRAHCHLVPGTPVSPMLAKPTKSVDEVLKRLSGQRLTVEFKYDGERMQLHRLADGSVRIFSRSQEDTTQRWPELASSDLWSNDIFTNELCKAWGNDNNGTFVLDAEVVAWDVKKKMLLPFQVLSTRKRKAAEDEEQAVQVIVQGFDLLYLHGRSLLRQPLIVRRDLMRRAFTEVEGKFTFARSRDVDLRDDADKKRDAAKEEEEGEGGGGEEAESEAQAASSSSSSGAAAAVEEPAPLPTPELTPSGEGGAEGGGDAGGESAEDGEQMIAAFMGDAVEGSCEGLMVKTLYGASATYEPSVRSLNWLKLKKDYMDGVAGGADSLDLVPIGAYKGKGKRTGVWGAYLLACYDPDSDEFQSVCKIGTGFSDEALQSLSDQLAEDCLPVRAQRPRNFNLGDSLEPDVYLKASKVWEVRAADLSLSSTHKGGIGKPGVETGRGIGLRFPRFIRERTDKPPSNATTAEQIRDLYFDQQSVAAGLASSSSGGNNGDDLDMDEDFI